jgi:hypothetical protein
MVKDAKTMLDLAFASALTIFGLGEKDCSD